MLGHALAAMIGLPGKAIAWPSACTAQVVTHELAQQQPARDLLVRLVAPRDGDRHVHRIWPLSQVIWRPLHELAHAKGAKLLAGPVAPAPRIVRLPHACNSLAPDIYDSGFLILHLQLIQERKACTASLGQAHAAMSSCDPRAMRTLFHAQAQSMSPGRAPRAHTY